MRYDYKFVRVDPSEMLPQGAARPSYQGAVEAHAADGWRLVQIFAPGDSFGSPRYVELIFERPVAESPAA